MRLFDATPVYSLFFVTISAFGAPPVASSSPPNEPDGQISDSPIDAASDSDAKLRFAPMWMAASKYPPDFGESHTAVPSASYAMIWQTEWQNELGLSAEQKKALLAIHAKALADINRHTQHFKSLPPEDRKTEVKSWGGKPAPWRQQLDNEIRTQIESVLTPRQLQTLREFSFPMRAVDFLYEEDVRREIGFGSDQEDRFRRVVKEKLARSQEEYLKQADRIWGLLSPQQQRMLPEVVKRQGPTSAVLSIADFLGFDTDGPAHSYPLLAAVPVRERLELDAEQTRQLDAVILDTAVRSRKIRQETSKLAAEAYHNDRRIEAILTPQQLTLLKEIDFRRKVVLALGYPEKREAGGITEDQTAKIRRLHAQTHKQLYSIDREMLDKALEILTPRQREQLSREIDQRIGE